MDSCKAMALWMQTVQGGSHTNARSRTEQRNHEYSGFQNISILDGKTTSKRKMTTKSRERFDPERGAKDKAAIDVANEYMSTIQDGTCVNDGERVRFFHESGNSRMSAITQTHEVPADGSCFFHAVHLTAPWLQRTAQELREGAVQEVESHPERYANGIPLMMQDQRRAERALGYVAATDDPNMTELQRYVNEVKYQWRFVDDVLISATASKYNLEIRRYSGMRGEAVMAPADRSSARPIHVYSHGDRHFMAIVPNEGMTATSPEGAHEGGPEKPKNTEIDDNGGDPNECNGKEHTNGTDDNGAIDQGGNTTEPTTGKDEDTSSGRTTSMTDGTANHDPEPNENNPKVKSKAPAVPRTADEPSENDRENSRRANQFMMSYTHDGGTGSQQDSKENNEKSTEADVDNEEPVVVHKQRLKKQKRRQHDRRKEKIKKSMKQNGGRIQQTRKGKQGPIEKIVRGAVATIRNTVSRILSKAANYEGPMSNTTETMEEEIDAANVPIDKQTTTKQAAKRTSTDAAPEQDGTRHENAVQKKAKISKMPAKSPRPPYQVGRPMRPQRCTDEEIEHRAGKSKAHQNVIDTGVVTQPMMNAETIDTRTVYPDMLGTRKGRDTRLRVGSANVQHIGAGNYDKVEYWAAMATMYDVDYLFLTELAATDKEMSKLRMRLSEIDMAIEWSLSPETQGTRNEPGLYRSNISQRAYPSTEGPDGTGTDGTRIEAESEVDVTEITTINSRVMLKIVTAHGARWAPLISHGKTNFTSKANDETTQDQRRYDSERRGGIAVLMSKETEKLTSRTYEKWTTIEPGRSMSLTMHNDTGPNLSIIGSYLQSAPYDASRPTNRPKDNAKQRNQDRNMSTRAARTNNQIAAESVRRVQHQVRRMTEAGHEIIWAGDFNIPLSDEDELSRPKGYRFPRSAINIRTEINKMPLRDLHRACHPDTRPNPTHFRHGRIDNKAATRAKLDYCLGTQLVLDSTVGATTIDEPVRDGKTDHSMVLIEIDIGLLTGSKKATAASTKPAPRVAVGAGSNHTKYAEYKKALNGVDGDGRHNSTFHSTFGKTRFTNGTGSEHDEHNTPTFKELGQYLASLTKGYWGVAKECALLTDKPMNPDSGYTKKLEHQDDIEALSGAISQTKGKIRQMKKHLDEARDTEYERRRHKANTTPGKRRNDERDDDATFKIDSTRGIDSVAAAVKMTTILATKHSPKAKTPAKQTVNDMNELRVWQTIDDLAQLLERRTTTGNDAELREWAQVAINQLTHADSKAKGLIRRRKKEYEDNQRSSNYRTAIGDFFKSMRTRMSTGYHHTTAYVPHDKQDDQWVPDSDDEGQDETYNADTGYHAVTSAKAVGDAFRDAWRDVYSGDKKPKPESAMYKRLFRNRASDAQRTGLKDVLRPATMHEFQAALELCNDRSAVGHDRSAYVAVKRATDDVQKAMLAAINCCLAAGDIPDEWRHARIILLQKDLNRPASATDNNRPVSLVSCHLKILERVLAARISGQIEKHGGLPDSQYGGRPRRSTTQPLNIVADAIEQANQDGTPLFITSYDFAKAFDGVPFQCIADGLKAQGLPDDYIKFFWNTCERRTAAFVTGHGDSDNIDIKTSCFQGTVLSGLMFNIAMAGMNEVLNELPGTMLPNSWSTEQIEITAVNYCDDTLTMNTDIEATQDAAYTMHEIADVTAMTLHAKKTKMVVAGLPDGHAQEYQILIGPRDAKQGDNGVAVVMQLKRNESMKYLGILFRGDGLWDDTQNMMTEKIEKELLKLGSVSLDENVTAGYIRQLIIPRILYAGTVAYLSDEFVDGVDVKIRAAAKHAMGLRSGTANAYLYDERAGAGIQSFRDRLDEAKIHDMLSRLEQDGQTVEGTTATARLQATMDILEMSEAGLMTLTHVKNGQCTAWSRRTNARAEDFLRAAARRGIGFRRSAAAEPLCADDGRIRTSDVLPYGWTEHALPGFIQCNPYPEQFMQDRVGEQVLRDRTTIHYRGARMTHRQYKQLEYIVECSAISINAAPPFNARTGTTLTNGRGRLQPGDLVLWDIDVENGTYHCNYGVVKAVAHQDRYRGQLATANEDETMVKRLQGTENTTVTTWANKTTMHVSDSEDETRTKDVPACEVCWMNDKETRGKYSHDGQAERRRLWTPAIDLVLKARTANDGEDNDGWIIRCEHFEEQDNLIAVNGRKTKKGVMAKWHYTGDEIRAANDELGYDDMQRNTNVEAHLFDPSSKTGTPDDAATMMMDVQYLRNEKVTTTVAAERMWITRFSTTNASSILKWTEAQYDVDNGEHTGNEVRTRSVREGIARIRHYLRENATHVPIESQQYAWKVLDRIEVQAAEGNERQDTGTRTENENNTPMDTGPQRKPPTFPRKPRWEDPAFDLDRWRAGFLAKIGIKRPDALRKRLERRDTGQDAGVTTYHLGVDGSYYARPCMDEVKAHGTGDTGTATTADTTRDSRLTMAMPAEPTGAGTAAISVREEIRGEVAEHERDAKRNMVGEGEMGFHVPGPVASSTYTESWAAIALALTAPAQMAVHGVKSIAQDNDGARQTMQTATRELTTKESMSKTNRPVAVLARCAQRWRAAQGGEHMELEHVKGHADKDTEATLTPQEKANVRADHICLMTYDTAASIEAGDTAMTTEQREAHIKNVGKERYEETHHRRNIVLPRATRACYAVEEPTMAMFMPTGTDASGTGTKKAEHYTVAPPKTVLAEQRRQYWQRELQRHRVHGALSTHPCDEVLLRQRKNFRATPQIKRMTQKAKTQTVPVLSERMRLNPTTPGYPDSKATAARHGPEDGCIFCDHRSGWDGAMERAKHDEELAAKEAKQRYTQNRAQRKKNQANKKAKKSGQTTTQAAQQQPTLTGTDNNTDKEPMQGPKNTDGDDEDEDGDEGKNGAATCMTGHSQDNSTDSMTTTPINMDDSDDTDGDADDLEAEVQAAEAVEAKLYPRDTFAHMLRCPQSKDTIQQAMIEIMNGINERISSAAKRTAKADKEWQDTHTATEYHWTLNDVFWIDTTAVSEERMNKWATPYTGTPIVQVWPTGRDGRHRPDEMLRQANMVATWASFPPTGLREKLKAALMNPEETQAAWNRLIQPALAKALHKMVHDRIDIEETWAIDRTRHPEHIHQSYRKRTWPDETVMLQRAWNRACKDLEATMVMAAAHRHLDRNDGVRHDLSEVIEIDNIQKRTLRDDMRTLLENTDRWEHLEQRRLETEGDADRPQANEKSKEKADRANRDPATDQW